MVDVCLKICMLTNFLTDEVKQQNRTCLHMKNSLQSFD